MLITLRDVIDEDRMDGSEKHSFLCDILYAWRHTQELRFEELALIQSAALTKYKQNVQLLIKINFDISFF